MAARALDELDHMGENAFPTIMNLTHPASLETMAVLSRGRAHFQAGDLEQARDWLERGLATQGATYPIWKVSGLGSLGTGRSLAGQHGTSRCLVGGGIDDREGSGSLGASLDRGGLPDLHSRGLGAGRARSRTSVSLHEGILRAEANRRSQLSWFGHLEAALLLEADGKREEAMTTVLSARSDLGAPPPPVVADRLLALQGRLLRLGGAPEPEPAVAPQRVSGFSGVGLRTRRGGPDPGRPQPGSKVGRDVFRIDRSNASSGDARRSHSRRMAGGNGGSLAFGRRQLTEALAVAESHSLVEPFVRAGPAIVEWSPTCLMPNLPFRAGSSDELGLSPRHPSGNDLVEPLTDRELEILSYLPSRLTNTELADHLCVSVNTIKTHMAHIYRKLGVANRNRAISRAREIGISNPSERHS